MPLAGTVELLHLCRQSSIQCTSEALQELFNTYGTAETVKLITEQEIGRLCGFGFVEMASGVNEAIAALHEKDFEGRQLTVNLVKLRE